ncbi:DNA repair protein complementing XP-C cell [Thelohanellus kitauei]|uniref:DNA repair protein complementing XP-C cell n=1 Tax=Thelohanellus kitauei TaxID=669202 RepID=A0A0C2M996_THEKT|nr:DNA repair protein complementing XP-C cell [Thelohanellus kitauei]
MPVYPRSCVHTGEKPIKTMTRKTISKREKTLELFGEWQTERFNPGDVMDDKIPKNEFGNIELYKPWMLPKGSVHIFLPNAAKIARKMDIEYAPAVTDWEYGHHPHPLINGIIVLKKDVKGLLTCYREMENELNANKIKKRSERALKNWKRIIQSIVIKMYIDKKYVNEE